MTACPKCGYLQNEGSECLSCGIVFERYRISMAVPRHTAQAESIARAVRPRAGRFRRFYRVFRWVTLIWLIFTIVMILRPSAPPRIESAPGALDRAEARLHEFQTSMQQHRADTLEMDEPELNEWLGANLALERPVGSVPAPVVRPEGSAIDLAKKALTLRSGDAPAPQQEKSTVRDVKITLGEESLRIYAVFDLHGLDLSLELEGRLSAQDGYLRLEPTSGKLGSLPLLPGALESTARRVFDSPENREKFRLPPQIRDMRIKHGRLIVSSR